MELQGSHADRLDRALIQLRVLDDNGNRTALDEVFELLEFDRRELEAELDAEDVARPAGLSDRCEP